MLNFDLIIQPATDGYAWGLYPQGQDSPRLQGTFRLDTVELKGTQVNLIALDDAFTHFRKDILSAFDEAAQLQLGRYLYQLMFADTPDDLFPSQEEILLRVVSDDAFIQRLPWNLLTQHNTFLVMDKWHITVATQENGKVHSVQFADAPKVLLVCQEPSDQTATKAREHGNELLQYFQQYVYYLNPQVLAVVSDWDGFRRKLDEQHWDVIYYYGHGHGDGYGASLLFADSTGNTVQVTMGKLASMLKESPPSLLYLNACRSGSNGIAGSVTQLGTTLPALVVNRTDAFTDAAREQARVFLGRLLLDHYPPHQAITHAYRSKERSLAAVRWMTPILYQHYTHWQFPNSNVQRFVGKDMHWKLKLDRTKQFEKIFLRFSNMLVLDTPLTTAYFWYGTKQQGVERFHERLPKELQKRFRRDMELLPTFHFRWPPHFVDLHHAYENMVSEGFQVSVLTQLPDKLLSLWTADASVPLVIHCQFATLRFGQPVSLWHVARLLEWWGREIHAPLMERNIRTVLAFAYELDEPDPEFVDMCQAEMQTCELKPKMKLDILHELETVDTQDVLDFLETFEIDLPVAGEARDHLIRDIVRRAGGDYEQVLCELQTIVSQAYKLLAVRKTPVASKTTTGKRY